MTTDIISPDLKTTLRRLKLSRMLDTLPERLTLARQQKMPHQDLLLLVLSDEVARRESLGVALRVQKAHLDPAMHLDAWDATAKVTVDRTLLNELASLRFLDAHAHVTIVGPVGVGKTFLAHALGHTWRLSLSLYCPIELTHFRTCVKVASLRLQRGPGGLIVCGASGSTAARKEYVSIALFDGGVPRIRWIAHHRNL